MLHALLGSVFSLGGSFFMSLAAAASPVSIGSAAEGRERKTILGEDEATFD